VPASVGSQRHTSLSTGIDTVPKKRHTSQTQVLAHKNNCGDRETGEEGKGVGRKGGREREKSSAAGVGH
jgi:hypothetical protein